MCINLPSTQPGQSWWTPAWIQMQEIKLNVLRVHKTQLMVSSSGGSGGSKVLVPVGYMTFKSQFPATRSCILSRFRSTFTDWLLVKRWEVVSVCLESLLIAIYHMGFYCFYRSTFFGLASYRPNYCHPLCSLSYHHLCLFSLPCTCVFMLCFHSCPCSDPFVSCCPWPCLDLCPVSDYRYLQICKSVVLSAFPLVLFPSCRLCASCIPTNSLISCLLFLILSVVLLIM